jgi:curved DNA-binding protein CbpA
MPEHSFTFYELLGVPETADSEAITRAFRKLAKLYHPDGNPDGGAQTASMFKALVTAYDTLRDDGLRASYDAELRAEREEPAHPPPPRSSQASDFRSGSASGGESPPYRESEGFATEYGLTTADLIARLRNINRRGRIAFWWAPSLIGFPFFAWLEARRITGNKRFTRLVVGYITALCVIGAIGVPGFLAIYWFVGIVHTVSRHRTVRAQAIARLAGAR